jgi:hypothetical protein
VIRIVLEFVFMVAPEQVILHHRKSAGDYR